MKNEIKRKALQTLANAPAIAAKTFIQALQDKQDKHDATALFEALGVLKKEEKKQ